MSFESLGKILQKTTTGIAPGSFHESEELLDQFKTCAAKILPKNLQTEYEIGFVKDGVLRLFVAHAAVAQQLQLYKHKLLEELSHINSRKRVSQILFQQKRT